VQANADRQTHALFLLEAHIEALYRRQNPQPGMHRPLGVVFMCLGPAKIHQQAVTQILGNMPLVALDDFGTGLLIDAQYSPQVFWV
jgi:hypothetical protein